MANGGKWPGEAGTPALSHGHRVLYKVKGPVARFPVFGMVLPNGFLHKWKALGSLEVMWPHMGLPC